MFVLFVHMLYLYGYMRIYSIYADICGYMIYIYIYADIYGYIIYMQIYADDVNVLFRCVTRGLVVVYHVTQVT